MPTTPTAAVLPCREQYSSAALASELKKGSRSAFEYLYLNYAAALNNIICRSISDTLVAEEVLQNVFVKIWRNIDLYEKNKATLFTWMLTICRHEVIDHLRSRHARQSRMTIWSTEKLPEKATLPFWDRPDLRIMFSMLSHSERVLIDLIYCKGFTFAETAALLSMPVGSVKTRARAIFQKWKTRTHVKQQVLENCFRQSRV